ncbi:unnamed protein product, partial [Protopolystoma xenopodis]
SYQAPIPASAFTAALSCANSCLSVSNSRDVSHFIGWNLANVNDTCSAAAPIIVASTAELVSPVEHTELPTIVQPTSIPTRPYGSMVWCGRSLWMDNSYPDQVHVPHTFVLHRSARPTICQHCKRRLHGLFRQGMQCKGQ